jgi:protein ImuB
LNDLARAAGLDRGMTKLEAEACAGLIIWPRSHEAEQAAHTALFECGISFSPQVEAMAADTLLLEISGLERLFGSPHDVAQRLKERVVDSGFECSIGIAPNPDAAFVAARGFPGVTVLDGTAAVDRLGTLSIDFLTPSVDFVQTLAAWGIRTLQQVADLPTIPLSERLGQEGVRLQQRAQGALTRLFVPTEQPPKFEESYELEEPVDSLEPLSFLLAPLLEGICAKLSARALAARELTLELGIDIYPDHEIKTECKASCVREQHTCHLRLPVPLADPKVLLKLVRLNLEANPPIGAVRRILLRAEPAKPRLVQHSFLIPTAHDPARLEVTLGRLRKIVQEQEGNVRVGSPEVLDTHRPDAFRMAPFTADRQIESNESHIPTAPVTAFRRYRPASHIRVEEVDGQPALLQIRRSRQRVLSAAGPWRSSGDWWTTEPWAREEWDVVATEKDQVVVYRVCHDLVTGRWLLEGSYD